MAKQNNNSTRQMRDTPVWWDRLKEILGYVFLPITLVVMLVQRISMGKEETAKLNEEAKGDIQRRDAKRNEERLCEAKHKEIKQDLQQAVGEKYHKSAIYLVPFAARTEERQYAIEVVIKDPQSKAKEVYTLFLDKNLHVSSDVANEKVPAELREKIEKIMNPQRQERSDKNSQKQTDTKEKTDDTKEKKDASASKERKANKEDHALTKEEQEDMRLPDLGPDRMYYVLDEKTYDMPKIDSQDIYSAIRDENGEMVLWKASKDQKFAAQRVGSIKEDGGGKLIKEISFDYKGKTYVGHIDEKTSAVYVEGKIPTDGKEDCAQLLDIMSKNHLILNCSQDARDFICNQVEIQNMNNNTFFMANAMFEFSPGTESTHAVFLPTGENTNMQISPDNLLRFVVDRTQETMKQRYITECGKEAGMNNCVYIPEQAEGQVQEKNFAAVHQAALNDIHARSENVTDYAGQEARVLGALLQNVETKENYRGYAYIAVMENNTPTGYFASIQSINGNEEQQAAAIYKVQNGKCIARVEEIKNDNVIDAIRCGMMKINTEKTFTNVEDKVYTPDQIKDVQDKIEDASQALEEIEAEQREEVQEEEKE